MIHTGDCVQVMRGMGADSVDAVVTDPPYGLEFMGRSWDRLGDVGKASHAGFTPGMKLTGSGNPTDRMPQASYNASANKKCRKCKRWAWDHEGRKCECEVPDFPNVGAHQGRLMQDWHFAWAVEALRVTKPGGYLLAFGGTRTHHRLVCGLEDAGWIIRDELDWIYASGFPKGKANLKPAHEPIVLARKPGPLQPLQIDATRIGVGQHVEGGGTFGGVFGNGKPANHDGHDLGRWPSNVLLGTPELFDSANPYVVGSGATTGPGTWTQASAIYGTAMDREGAESIRGDDSGGYSRFFIVPKADRADREPIVRGQLTPQDKHSAECRFIVAIDAASSMDEARVISMDTCDCGWYAAFTGRTTMDGGEFVADGRTASSVNHARPRENAHPTVKPVDLMRHLVRLVTPPGGTVLDCFLGSGSTAIACEIEGFPWIGIEKEPEYVAIAEARLNGTQRGLGLDVPAPTTQKKPSTSHWPARRTPHKSEGWGFSGGQEGLEERYEKPPEEAA